MSDSLRYRFANAAERLNRSFYTLTTEDSVQHNGLTEDPVEDFSTMVFRERTSEFSIIVKNIQSRQLVVNGVKPATHKNAGNPNPRREFTDRVRKVGRDLAETCKKLEKLTMLAKRKTLFDDKPLEVQELTVLIKQDLNRLNKQIAELQSLNKARNASSNQHVQTHSTTVVTCLQSKLANVSADFKSVLDVRTENLRATKQRREQFSQWTPAASKLGNSGGGSILMRDEQMSTIQTEGATAIDMHASGEVRPRHSAAAMQMALVEQGDQYMAERADAMQNIESTVVELGHIFQQLASLVKEQQEQVHVIDGNVEDSLMHVTAAHTEILKYFQSVSSNRWLMIKVFGVLIVFFIVFVLFFT